MSPMTPDHERALVDAIANMLKALNAASPFFVPGVAPFTPETNSLIEFGRDALDNAITGEGGNLHLDIVQDGVDAAYAALGKPDLGK